MSDEEGSKSPSPHRIARACFAAAAAAPFLLWLTEWAQGNVWLAMLVIGACEASLAVLTRFWPALTPRFLTPDAAFHFSFRKHYLDDLVFQNRTLDVKGFTIQGPYALDMEYVFVEVGIAPIAVRDASADMLKRVPQHLREGRHPIWEYLVDVEHKSPALVILGAPGSGKTTLLKHIALNFAHNRAPHPQLKNNVPILFLLREHAATISKNPHIRLVDLLSDHLKKTRELNIPSGWFARVLESSRALIMFDGLDEMADYEQRRCVVAWVERQLMRHGRNRFIITSRPFGYTNNTISGVTVLCVLPFTQPQVSAFINKWYLATEIRRQLRDDEGVRQDAKRGALALMEALRQAPALGELAVNPLFLTMIATVHRYHSALPGTRVPLYAQILDAELGRRQHSKGLDSTLTSAQTQSVLQPLAWNMMVAHRASIKADDAALAIADTLRLVAPDMIPAVFLTSVGRRSSIILETEPGVYEFAHLIFQEYLAACNARAHEQYKYALNAEVGSAWWKETIRLYCAMGDATETIKACMLKSAFDPEALALAIECRAEAKELDPTLRQELDTLVNSRLSGVSCYICCAQDGTQYARALTTFLRTTGVDVFISDSVLPGERWVEVISTQLEHAMFFILIGTPKAFESQWVLRELESFSVLTISSGDRRILPVMFFETSSVAQVPDVLTNMKWLEEDDSTLHDGPSERALRHLVEALVSVPESGRARLRRTTSAPDAKEKRPLNEGKLILVGRGAVGKTSLVRRLANDAFRDDESTTNGIYITDWPLLCGSERLRLHVWDFGGQEIMHATHQFFLTERSLYIVVLNGREGGEDIDAEYWLKHIETFGGDCPVIVVQNKITQHPFDLNYRGLQARHPQIRGFVKTDCKDAVGIGELRQLIRSLAAEMPEIRMQFPSDWFAVKEQLQLIDDDFMSFARFGQVCYKEGILDESDRDTLCWVLHCLGIVLHYRDDPRLRETNVLKPEWVTQGIYRLLTARKVAEQLGELHLNDLRGLLPGDRYPIDKHRFLLELMRKFSLCFAFPDEPDRFLIPELLGKEEPEETAAFMPDDCLNFEYYYGILPEGLIPRFIVRSHTLSQDQARWRTGVVLAYEDCKALVTAVTAERRVIVRVAGGDAGARRRLLAIIRYDLDRINQEFKDRLDVDQKVPLTDFPAFAIDYKKLVAFERQGVTEFPECIGKEVVIVNVNELLNGVDLATQREESLDVSARAKSIFFSYSHQDEGLRDELETHLKLLQRQGVISAWHDRKILAGSEWDHEIDHHLERARIVLLLVSADFIASEYCWENEVKRALERHEAGDATVIPVILRACDWQGAPFAKLQGLPKEMKPVTSWQDRDAAWTDIATGIREVAEKLK